jgi:hypothetical protein
MTMAELAAGHEQAWKKVYRWSSIARRLWKARNFQPLALSANIGYRYYAHRLHQFYHCDWQIDPMLPDARALFNRAAPAAVESKPSKNRAVCG